MFVIQAEPRCTALACHMLGLAPRFVQEVSLVSQSRSYNVKFNPMLWLCSLVWPARSALKALAGIVAR